jgi:hypothetical protein
MSKSTSDKRSFTIKINGKKFGRLISRTPRQAAQKAVSCLERRHASGELKNEYTKNDWNEFKIIETTRGSNKKEFGYRGIRQERDEPVEAQIAGKTITCRFDTKVYSTRGQTGGVKGKGAKGKGAKGKGAKGKVVKGAKGKTGKKSSKTVSKKRVRKTGGKKKVRKTGGKKKKITKSKSRSARK